MLINLIVRAGAVSLADELERMHDFLSVENSVDKRGGVDRIYGIDPMRRMRPNIAVWNNIATLALEGISSLSKGLASDVRQHADKSAASAANYDNDGVERKQ